MAAVAMGHSCSYLILIAGEPTWRKVREGPVVVGGAVVMLGVYG